MSILSGTGGNSCEGSQESRFNDQIKSRRLDRWVVGFADGVCRDEESKSRRADDRMEEVSTEAESRMTGFGEVYAKEGSVD